MRAGTRAGAPGSVTFASRNVAFTTRSQVRYTAMRSFLAYLDAGTGSLILQLILGGTAALAVGVRLWWHRLVHLLHIRRRSPATESEPRQE